MPCMSCFSSRARVTVIQGLLLMLDSYNAQPFQLYNSKGSLLRCGGGGGWALYHRYLQKGPSRWSLRLTAPTSPLLHPPKIATDGHHGVECAHLDTGGACSHGVLQLRRVSHVRHPFPVKLIAEPLLADLAHVGRYQDQIPLNPPAATETKEARSAVRVGQVRRDRSRGCGLPRALLEL